MVTEAAFSSAPDATTAIARNFSQSAGCSIEQILSPINIVKGNGGSTPGFQPPFTGGSETGAFSGAVGPTVNELNPYFSRIFGDNGTNFITYNDYNVVVNDVAGNGTMDLNLKKNPYRSSITSVRTQAFRGPMILSGWGFDIADLPVPSVAGNKRQFDANLVNQRGYWKTGPVHLMWDDQRQVWCGGPQILCGVLKGPITSGSPKSPSLFPVKILRISSTASNFVASYQSLDTGLGEQIMCVNRSKDFTFEPSQQDLDQENIFVVCARINYEWILLSLEQKPSSSIYIGTFNSEWKKGTNNTVSQITPTPTTTTNVSVMNLFSTVGRVGQASQCAYVKINNDYYLIAAECL